MLKEIEMKKDYPRSFLKGYFNIDEPDEILSFPEVLIDFCNSIENASKEDKIKKTNELLIYIKSLLEKIRRIPNVLNTRNIGVISYDIDKELCHLINMYLYSMNITHPLNKNDSDLLIKYIEGLNLYGGSIGDEDSGNPEDIIMLLKMSTEGYNITDDIKRFIDEYEKAFNNAYDTFVSYEINKNKELKSKVYSVAKDYLEGKLK